MKINNNNKMNLQKIKIWFKMMKIIILIKILIMNLLILIIMQNHLKIKLTLL